MFVEVDVEHVVGGRESGFGNGREWDAAETRVGRGQDMSGQWVSGGCSLSMMLTTSLTPLSPLVVHYIPP